MTDPCVVTTVAQGERWCATHESAAPCPFGAVLAKVARGVVVHRLETPELCLLDDYYSELDSDTITDDQDGHWGAVVREIEARELWESDDDRVRESVGNYR